MIQPNIPQETIRLLWLDRNDTISFLFTVDGQPVDATNRTFKLCFYNESAPIGNPLLTIDNTRLAAVEGRSEKRAYLPTADDRALLPVDGKFNAVLFETTTGVDDYFAFFKFDWLKTPETTDFSVGQGLALTRPRQVPSIQLNVVTTQSNVQVVQVYEVPAGPVNYAGLAAALTAPLPAGQAQCIITVTSDGQKFSYLKEADGITPYLMGQKVTLANLT